jgi:transcriptional regulator with XRE-family HTH domain
VGVSRNWYRRLENGTRARASMKLLDRLANAFVFTPEERTKLFVLAIPEIGHIWTRREPRRSLKTTVKNEIQKPHWTG